MSKMISRRTLLRGALGCAGVAVGLPFLECFLNSSGTALASGAPMPVRFGTWHWTLGMHRQLFTPDCVGRNYDIKEELEAIRPYKDQINIFSNYQVRTDDRPSLCHHTGWVALRCGQAPVDRQTMPGPSIDVIIGDQVGGGTRLRSLEMTATGEKGASVSFRDARSINPPDVSPLGLYQRVFGPEFQDPNSPDFHPNPELMLRKSVLSAVREDSARLKRKLGAADRERLDQYFTSIRSLEQRLALQLQKPPPVPNFRMPPRPPEVPTVGQQAQIVAERHNLMTDILVMALASNQTRVFNMVYSFGAAATTKQGVPSTHHAITHEEAEDEHGIQETHTWFVRRAMDCWGYFVGALASHREGDRSLLDNTLVFGHSDHEWAKVHTMNGTPMMTAGRAGGRIKTGLHVDCQGKHPATAVGLTLMRVMGLELAEWGGGSMRTTEGVSEILA
jgi:hypothetical protein